LGKNCPRAKCDTGHNIGLESFLPRITDYEDAADWRITDLSKLDIFFGVTCNFMDNWITSF
jgi:hypothetical protein